MSRTRSVVIAVSGILAVNASLFAQPEETDSCQAAASTIPVCNTVRDAADGASDDHCHFTWDGVTYEALGFWCKTECENCTISIGPHLKSTGECITYGSFSAAPPAHTSTCLCRGKGLPASAESSGQAQTEDPYVNENSVMHYVWPEPTSAAATVFDCGGGTIVAAFTALSFTIEFGQFAATSAELPIGITQFDATLAAATVCGQAWGESSLSLTQYAVGFIETATGDLTTPIAFEIEMENDEFGVNRPRLYQALMVGNVDLLGDGVADVTIHLVAEPCIGDLDRDADIDLSDLGILLSDYGCTTGPCAGDANGDGATDLSDLGIALSGYGLPCF